MTFAPPGPAELAEIVRRPAEAADLGFGWIRPPARASMSGCCARPIGPTAAAHPTGTGPALRGPADRGRPDGPALRGLCRPRRLTGIIDEVGERALADLAPVEIARLPRLTRGLAEMGGAGGPLAGTLTVRPLPLAEAAADEPLRRLVDALVRARF